MVNTTTSAAIDLNDTADGTSLAITDGAAVSGSVSAPSGKYKVQLTLTQTASGMTAVPLNELCYLYAGLTTNLTANYISQAITFANKVYLTGTVTVTNPSKAATGSITLTAYQADGALFSPSITKVFENPAYTGSNGVYTNTYTLGLPIEAVGTTPVVKVSFANTLDSADYTVTYTPASPAANLTQKGAADVNPSASITEKTGIGTISVLPPTLPGDADIDLEMSASSYAWQSGTIQAAVMTNASDFSAFAWYIDGQLVPWQGDFIFSKSANLYSLGQHTLTVIATKTADGKDYSKTVQFSIVKQEED
jgi:hypothetical protein